MENHGYIWEPFILVLENHGHPSFFESQTWEPPVIKVPHLSDNCPTRLRTWWCCTSTNLLLTLLTLLLTSALTHLYGCANFHLSKWHELNMWNTRREYELKLRALGWWACLCGGGFLFNMTNDPSNRTHLQRQTKRYTSTTELQLPKRPKLSSPARTATEPSVWYLTTSEFAVSVSVIKLMNAIDLFFWKKFPNNLHICIYQTDFP